MFFLEGQPQKDSLLCCNVSPFNLHVSPSNGTQHPDLCLQIIRVEVLLHVRELLLLDLKLVNCVTDKRGQHRNQGLLLTDFSHLAFLVADRAAKTLSSGTCFDITAAALLRTPLKAQSC